jgi:hypothetical protein
MKVQEEENKASIQKLMIFFIYCALNMTIETLHATSLLIYSEACFYRIIKSINSFFDTANRITVRPIVRTVRIHARTATT